MSLALSIKNCLVQQVGIVYLKILSQIYLPFWLIFSGYDEKVSDLKAHITYFPNQLLTMGNWDLHEHNFQLQS